nr:MAG TPA: hypothetical protein [Caudoviricetes sp.]
MEPLTFILSSFIRMLFNFLYICIVVRLYGAKIRNSAYFANISLANMLIKSIY